MATKTITLAKKEDLNLKVDKISGKGLSTNDFTDSEKDRLSEVTKVEKSERNGIIIIDGTEAQVYDDTEIKEDVKTLNNQVNTEKTERQSADSALETKIADEAKTAREAESNEKSRAETAEKTLQSNIGTEATAREEADKALETKIADEAKTARAAEQSNATAITTESDRATKAETTLQNNIDSEATARKEADKALETSIDKCLYIDTEGYICLKEA